MYKIEKQNEYLLVRFEDNFDYNVVQTIIHHLTSMKEYPQTNDIWLIGKHHADIRLGELETLVQQFRCQCPKDAIRSKTAIVVEPGLTASIVELWMTAANKKVSFDMRLFNSLADAQVWLGAIQSHVA